MSNETEATEALDNIVKEAKTIEAGAEIVKSAIRPKKKGGSAKIEAIRKEKKVKGKVSVRKEAKLKKSAKQQAKRDKKYKAKKRTKARDHGPAFEKWKKKFRSERTVGQCFIKGCNTKPVGRAKFCTTHKKAYRKDQLKMNNVKWRKRVKSGEAGHHVVYDGEATRWATKDKLAAKRIVSDGHSIVPTVKEFEKILSKTVTGQKAKGKKAA